VGEGSINLSFGTAVGCAIAGLIALMNQSLFVTQSIAKVIAAIILVSWSRQISTSVISMGLHVAVRWRYFAGQEWLGRDLTR